MPEQVVHHLIRSACVVAVLHAACRITTEGAGAVRGHNGFRFEAIPDGEADRAELTGVHGPAPGVPPVTCVLVLPTGLMTVALHVARELGILSMAFWCAGASSVMCYLMTQEERRIRVPLKGI
jgi:hypothetical protein